MREHEVKHDEDDPPVPEPIDFWYYFNRMCEQTLSWCRAFNLI